MSATPNEVLTTQQRNIDRAFYERAEEMSLYTSSRRDFDTKIKKLHNAYVATLKKQTPQPQLVFDDPSYTPEDLRLLAGYSSDKSEEEEEEEENIKPLTEHLPTVDIVSTAESNSPTTEATLTLEADSTAPSSAFFESPTQRSQSPASGPYSYLYNLTPDPNQTLLTGTSPFASNTLSPCQRP